ncbi:hypothetical protein LJU32_14150 [Pseudomonas sp. B21_DOA]|nr:hypothetical protein LJU32_14150 [Pseudomonas sp. B21_DOA]
MRFLALVHKKYPDIQRVTEFNLQPVIEKALLQVGNLSNIRPAFTTTVYAFLNPKLPSAAWDFLPAIWRLASVPLHLRAKRRYFVYYCQADFNSL